MTANKRQVGGDHYVNHGIQPWDAMESWMSKEEFAGFLRGNAIKYIARCNDKGGIQDIQKAQHYIEKLLEVLGDSMIDGNAVDDRPPSSTPNYMDALNEKASALVDKFNVPPAQSHEELTFGPPANVWIEWTGGECPVSKQTLVLVKLRVGCGSNNWLPARVYRWNHAPNESDIIAYKVMG